MKAGDLHIVVSAQMAAFNAQMAAVEAQAEATGINSGNAFQRNFAAGSEKIVGNLLKQFASPFAIAGVADFVAKGIREGFSYESVSSALKNVPFAGSFFNLGEAISEGVISQGPRINEFFRTIGLGIVADYNEAIMGKQVDPRLQQQAAAAMAELEDRRAETAKFVLDTTQKIAEIEEKRTRDTLSRADDQRQAIADLAQLEIDKIRKADEEYLKLQAARVEVLDGEARDLVQAELEAAQKLQDARITAIVEERDLKLKALDEAFVRETEQQMELAEKQRIADEKAAKQKEDADRKVAEAAAKELKRKLEDEVSDISDQIETITAGTAEAMRSTSDFSTALGSFRISAYTDAEKKRIDEASLKELQKLNGRVLELVNSEGFV
jgi:hypothetical protein